MIQPGQTFRALHEASGVFVIPNPWDIGSARILTNMGFRALATTSAGMAFALGKTDGTVCPETVLRHCRDIVAATKLPVSADLEKGFGDTPASVAETITAAAATGLAGCSIEDATGRKESPIYDRVFAVERIEAASEAAKALPQDFVLTARCEHFLWGLTDLDEVIRRLQAFESAGADVLYAPGLPDLDAIKTVCAALSKPVNVVMDTPGATFSIEELAEAGVKRISVGAAFSQLAYGALISAAREITEVGRFDFTSDAIDYFELCAYFNSPDGE